MAAPIAPLSQAITEIRSRWTELAQRDGLELLAEPQVNAFASRLARVTSHVAVDLGTIVFLGLKIKIQTVAELVLDFVVQSPAAPLPEHLDILQLLERFVDKQFEAYLRDKSIVVSSDDQDAILSAHRREFEDSHMEAALRSRLNGTDFYNLQPAPLFGENNMDRFNNLASGGEKPYFVDGMVNGKPRFVDVVFSNFFAAKWFAQRFQWNRNFLVNRLYTARRTVLRYLLDRILARNCELHVAVLHDDVAGVQRLLEVEGVDADKRDLAGRTALHLAAVRKTNQMTFEANIKIMDMLIDYMTDIHISDDLLGETPLRYADSSHAYPGIDRLLRRGADSRELLVTSTYLTSGAMLDSIFEHDLDALMAFCLDEGLPEALNTDIGYLLEEACEYGSLRVSTLLVARGADINGIEGKEDSSPFSSAASSGNLDLVAFLVQQAKLDSSLQESQQALAFINDISHVKTALDLAAQHGHPEVVAYLLKEGADVWFRNLRLETPLFGAISGGDPTVLGAILGAVDPSKLVEYVNIGNMNGVTALHIASEEGDTKTARTLVELGADIMAHNIYGWTPLYMAARGGNETTLKFLIDTVDDQLKGEYVNERDFEGMTAMHWVAYHDFHEVITLMVDRGASVAIQDDSGDTPLIVAARRGNVTTVQVLLDIVDDRLKSDYVNESDNEGKTALHWAALEGYDDVMTLLIDQGASVNIEDIYGGLPSGYADHSM